MERGMESNYQIEWFDNYHKAITFDEKDIARFEKKAGIVFLDSYKKDVLRTRAGSPRPNFFSYKKFNGNEVGQIVKFMSFSDREKYNMAEFYEFSRTFLPKQVVPIALCFPEDTICFEYLEGKREPRVVLWRVEYDERKEEEVDVFYPVADSYEDFLSRLHFDIHWSYVQFDLSKQKIHEYFSELEKRWNIRFPENYIRIASRYHGGKPDKNYFYYDDGSERNEARIDHFLRVDALEEVYLQNQMGQLVPFAICQDGKVLAHDCRNEKETVALFDTQQRMVFSLDETFTFFMNELTYPP